MTGLSAERRADVLWRRGAGFKVSKTERARSTRGNRTHESRQPRAMVSAYFYVDDEVRVFPKT
jgi:hypothetical protein